MTRVLHRASATGDRVERVMRTLIGNGYLIESFERPAPEACLVTLVRRDPLGAQSRAAILFTSTFPRSLQDRLGAEAKRHVAFPVVVGWNECLAAPAGVTTYDLTTFLDLLGGEIVTDRLFRPNLPAVLNELGHNRLPGILLGKPDDLLEAYGADALQFMLECPVRRFGQERRFEALPDALVLGRGQLNVLLDSKAYGQGFHPTADDIRRFSDYIRDFNQRYRHYIGPMSHFLVLSGSFSGDAAAIRAKADDLMAVAATPLVLMRAEDLGHVVDRLRAAPGIRPAVQWRRLLVPGLFALAAFNQELEHIRRDDVVA